MTPVHQQLKFWMPPKSFIWYLNFLGTTKNARTYSLGNVFEKHKFTTFTCFNLVEYTVEQSIPIHTWFLVIIPKSGGIVSWGEPFRRLCFCEPCQVYFHFFSLLGSNTQLIVPPLCLCIDKWAIKKHWSWLFWGLKQKIMKQKTSWESKSIPTSFRETSRERAGLINDINEPQWSLNDPGKKKALGISWSFPWHWVVALRFPWRGLGFQQIHQHSGRFLSILRGGPKNATYKWRDI